VEFELIERIRRRVARRDDVALGIGDDAALLRVPSGMELVVATDTLNAGVHFPPETAPSDIGWKALAVNLSDLASMGATPAWFTLSLCLPAPDPEWLDAFLDGALALANEHQVSLVGGDTTRGPLSISITALGFVSVGQALRRDGANVGDDVWITGSPGDAAAALSQWRAGHDMDPALRARLDRPTPRLAAGLALRGLAHACIDVSDGLLADLGHVLYASGVGARIDVMHLPFSSALADAFPRIAQRQELQLAGGDDYELCFTAPPDRRGAILDALVACDTAATRIGQVESEPGVRVIGADGALWQGKIVGWDHFAGASR
jgi:thiamine-monophosphate kinase